jgi:LPS sulfotransferase NodH
MIKFVILTTQRSGSTWVIDMLNSHPSVIAYSELFLKTSKERPVWGGAKDVLLWKAYRQRHEAGTWRPFGNIPLCFNYLDDIYTSQEEVIQSIGFKLMYGQLRQQMFCLLPYLLVNRVAIIHLVRLNFLDVILSEEAVRIRNTAHARDEVQHIQINLDPNTLLPRIRKKERKVNWARRVFSRLGLPYLEVSYEGLVTARVSFGAMLEYLGIGSGYEAMNTSFKRLNKGTHQELIENYNEVVTLLAGTEYAQLLD